MTQTRKIWPVLALLIVLAGLGLAPDAQAQDPVLETTAVDGPFAPPVSVTLRPREDTELNARLRPVLEEELKAIGIAVDEWSRVSLWYDTLAPSAGSPALSPMGRMDADTRSGVDMRMNVLSTSQSSLINGRKDASPIPPPAGQKDDPPANLDVPQLRMSLELSDTEAIRWRGKATLPAAGGDPFPDYESLTRALLPHLPEDAGWR